MCTQLDLEFPPAQAISTPVMRRVSESELIRRSWEREINRMIKKGAHIEIHRGYYSLVDSSGFDFPLYDGYARYAAKQLGVELPRESERTLRHSVVDSVGYDSRVIKPRGKYGPCD